MTPFPFGEHSTMTGPQSTRYLRRPVQSRVIYHLLYRAFGQSVLIAQIVDLNVLDVVAIGNIDFPIHFARALPGRCSRFRRR